MANQGILQHLDFIRAWRLADPAQSFRAGRQNQGMDAAGDDTPRPSPRQADKLKTLMAKYEGLTGQVLAQAMAEDIRKWANGGDIYFLGTENELKKMSETYFRQQKYEIVDKIELPEPPKEMSTGRRGGGMPGMGIPNRNRRTDDMARLPPAGGPPGMPDQGPGRNAGNFRRVGGFPGGGGGLSSLQGEKLLVIAKWKAADKTTKPDASEDAVP